MDNFPSIISAAHESASGINNLPEPTAEQARAGNYPKGRFMLHGLPIAIETPAGRRRVGKEDGKPWSVICMAHYGEIAGTKGRDGDPLDVFIGPWPESEMAYVVNRLNAEGGFDEHKILLAFPTQESAITAYTNSYEKGAAGIGSVIPCTIDQLKWWIKNGDHTVPLSASQLPYDGNAVMNETAWDSAAQPVGTDVARLMYALRRTDTDGLLLDAATVADIIEDSDGEIALDALVLPLNRLERQMTRMMRIMQASGRSVKPIAMQVTQPFKQRGTTNVAVVYEMSDGQSVSVFFHNPDSTPNRLTPDDEMVSWKWLLNKRDVTIVVAPERGRDLNPREVARRVMRLVEKNSARFAAANTRRAERLANIESMRAAIKEKETILADLQKEIVTLEERVAERRAKPPATLQTGDDRVDAEKSATGSTQPEPESVDNPTSPEGYAIVRGSQRLKLYHQDELDSFFQGRLIKIRNALRARGWDGERYKTLSKNGHELKTSFEHVGAGMNIVGMSFAIGQADGFSLIDDLTLTPEEVAARIDAALPTPAVVERLGEGERAEHMRAVRRALIALGYEDAGAGNMLIRRDGDRTISIKSVQSGEPDQRFLVTVLVNGDMVHDAEILAATDTPPSTLAQMINEEAGKGGDTYSIPSRIIAFRKLESAANAFGQGKPQFYGVIQSDGEDLPDDFMPETHNKQMAMAMEELAREHGYAFAFQISVDKPDTPYRAIVVFDPTGTLGSRWAATPEEAFNMLPIRESSEAKSTPPADEPPVAAHEQEAPQPDDQAAAEAEAAAAQAAAALEDSMGYLQSVIDGKVDLLDSEVAERLTELHDAHQGDPAFMELFEKAAQAYQDFVVAEAQKLM